MNNADLLQDALARLEAGERLETVAQNLSPEDAELLKLASTLQAAQPVRAASQVQAQRQALLKAAQTKSAPQSKPRSGWILPVAISSALLGVLALAFVSLAALGALWWNSRGGENVAQTSTNEAAVAVPLTPNTARLKGVKGLVQINGQVAREGELVQVGQTVRTSALSSVTLEFYDGSRVRLAPESEMRVEALDARTTGPRTIRLMQLTGDSYHSVAKSADPASVYEVNTPSGAGHAKGTEFQVSVTAIIVQFIVTEGAVEVGNVNVTVLVLAGYTTVINIGQPPATPALTIQGEGEVQSISTDVWRIANQNFAVTDDTVITGEPQVGDWAAFEGRILADGTRVADRITLLQRRISNTFSFIGTVENTSAEAWTISGRTVRVDAATEIETGLQVGNRVQVRGGIAADGTFWASSIELFETLEGETFTLTGVAQTISGTVWSVSGFTFTVDVSTTIETGIVVGDVVRVQGVVLENGERRALSIEKLADGKETEFSFVGIVISREPWNVSGVALQTDDETEIDEGIRVGNRVRVSGRLLADGTYLATEIEQLDNGNRHAVEFTARVQSIEPWVVGGITLTVDSKTQIDADIEVGDLVTVKGNLLPDGTVLAKKITRVAANNGCSNLTAIVVSVTGNTLTLLDGQTLTLDGSATLTGAPQTASIIIITVCVGEDGQTVIIAIIVVGQLPALPAPTPTPPPTTDGGKVTVCHKPDHKNGGKTMTVSAAAVGAHLGHGDTLGPCGGGGDDDDDDD